MTMKFHGDLKSLKHLLDRHDVHGSWSREPNGVHMMRGPDGSNLHWSSSSKSLWFDGKPIPKRRLATDVAAVLHMLGDDDPD